ncbi:cation:proton antiporter [Streptococcus uberis]|uniref:cation:proton antiporter n=1 Tax=Streptococcus uberis TaxID=1349 RepID=UPI003D787B5B
MPISLLVFGFLVALILSNVLNRIFPQIPTPAIQLTLGLLFGVLSRDNQIVINPELFLAFVIAPLNFREGQESDVKSFLRFRSFILYLILPTVLFTTLFLGLGVSTLLPIKIPLAICFALGAALAPTDAVAFLSLANRLKFPNRVKNILTSEGLLNDASSLVAFQFALTAFLTGTFSLAGASFKLALTIFGGIAVGLLFALLNRIFLSVLEKFDAADVTGALLLELALPVISYFIAELLGFSAIIAVVIAGVMQANRLKKVTLFDAQVDRVTKIIWETIHFMLNGFVFIVFGMEAAHFIGPVLTSPHYSNLYLFILVIAITALMFLIRFVMITLYYCYLSYRNHRSFPKYWKEIILLTFSGVKGSVSIATILLLPKEITPDFSLLLFIVGAVTLLSFLAGLLVLPKLAPAAVIEKDNLINIAILTTVSKELEEETHLNQENQVALYHVVDTYNKRIEKLILEQESNEVKSDLAELQLLILSIESKGLEYAFKNKEVSLYEYRIYQSYLKSLERDVNRSFTSSFTYALIIFLRVIRGLLHELSFFHGIIPNIRRIAKPRINLSQENRQHLTDLYLNNTALILDSLEDLEGFYNSYLVNFIQNQRIQNAELINSGLFVERVLTNYFPDANNEQLRGYYLERRTIHEFEQMGDITAKEAQQLRDQVNELESYSLRESSPNFAYDLIKYRQKTK